MKITFIRPNMTSARSSDAFHPLSLSLLAGMTPPDVEVELFDECIEEIPIDIETDIAAITVQTFTARRAYQIADSLRQSGTRVVMGGFHPSFMQQEALQHSDCVVAGEAEGVWERVVSDAMHGRLEKIYKQHEPVPLGGVQYDRHIFRGKKYAPVFPVEFSRGCKYSCEFCSTSAFYRGTCKSRPVKEVVEEIEKIDGKTILFVDDNMFADRQRARELMEALIPLKKRWGCQISIDVAKNDHLLDLMQKSGCVTALIGFESFRKENLRQMKKQANLAVIDYATAIKKIKGRGIMIYGSFIFGYDHDDLETFDACVDFALQHKLFLANFNTLNPMPGTGLFDRLKSHGRLIDERWWLRDKFKYGEVMFKPANMAPQHLKQGANRARVKFNSYMEILKRMLDFRANCRNAFNLFIFLTGNLIASREIRRKMRRIQ